MAAALLLVAQILPLIPSLIGDVQAIWTWIASVRTAAQQTGDWTDAQEQAWQAALIADGKTSDWQPQPTT